MDLRIATAIFLFLSLYLHASAHDELNHNHAKVHKHSEAFNKRTHKIPTRKSSDGKYPAIPPKAYKKSNIANDNNKSIFEQSVNSKEIIRREEIRMVNSAEIENPTLISKKMIKTTKDKIKGKSGHPKKEDWIRKSVYSEKDNMKSNEDRRKYTNIDKMYGRVKATMRKNQIQEPTATNKKKLLRKSVYSEKDNMKSNEGTRKYTNIDKMYGRVKATMRRNFDNNMRETTNSAELSSQIEEPSVISTINNKNKIIKEYASVKNKKRLDDPNEVTKEVIFFNGFRDLMDLLEILNLDIPEADTSDIKRDYIVITDGVPIEPKKSIIGLRRQFGTNSFREDSKELLNDESFQSKNVFQRRQLKENAISGDEIKSKRFITKINKKFDNQHKLLGEEIDNEYIYENSKPKPIKSVIFVKNKVPSARLIERVKEYNNEDFEKSIESSEIEDEDEVVTGINRNVLSKFEDYKVTKNPYSSTRKQFNEELIDEDNVNSNENIKVVEHIHRSNINSEPESFQKYIFIVNNNPLSNQQGYIKKEIAKSNGLYQDSEEIIKNTNNIQQKNPKIC